MAYKSIDELQKTLSGDVFKYTKDAKKAAGRALGTLIEIITYYLLREWGLASCVSIERGLEEYGNSEITHNVEFSLHPRFEIGTFAFSNPSKITTKEIAKRLSLNDTYQVKSNNVLDSENVVKNACVIAENETYCILANCENKLRDNYRISVNRQNKSPFAMFECKRVGVEEGAKKGPQTIEKAKQGAYVANATSSLQKIWNDKGERYGVIYKDGTAVIKPYFELLNELIHSEEKTPKNFILSIGVVSNHGNWFTSDDMNKELKVLAQSYDWLLFLTDDGLAQFVTELLLNPPKEYMCVRNAFLASYEAGKKRNVFTKVRMNQEAHQALIHYFSKNITKVEQWFNVIAPQHHAIKILKEDLLNLMIKNSKE